MHVGKRPKPFPCLGVPGFTYSSSIILYHAPRPLSSLLHLFLASSPPTCNVPSSYSHRAFTHSFTALRMLFSALFTWLKLNWASLVTQLVKNLPAMWETWVWSLGWEDPWGREWLPTPVFWPGEFHGLYSPQGHKESDTTEQLSLYLFNYHLFEDHS